ncbi:histone-like nucleoid-structuring protein Lsr2 [Streptomyces sp. NPDC046712]|uniref:Lsr2 family DNA-binding protein n=1 Tax=Streptomyces sp. NPDC046712 TaxID=3154802 RepID=UPI0033FCC2FA
MTNNIDRLTELCPPPPAAPSTDWTATEHTLGLALPADYEQIADTYGPGAFCGFLRLYHPHAPTQWINLTGPMPSTIRTQLQAELETGTYPVPIDPQQLLPMAVTDNGEYLYWTTRPTPEPPTGTTANTSDVRTWAHAHGYDVPDRGRIPATIIDAWRNAVNGRDGKRILDGRQCDVHGRVVQNLQ